MKRLSNMGLRFVLVLGLLYVSMTIEARAHPAAAQSAKTFDITLQSLGYSDRALDGPYDTGYYHFSLPSEWQPLPGSYLELHLDHTVRGEWSQVPALLTVRLNGSVLDSLALDTLGDLQLQLEIPPDVLRSSESDYVNVLNIILQADADCEFLQRTLLTVQNSSILHFVYGERPVPRDLALYPKPLYHSHAFEPSQVRFVLPPEPAQAEVRAAVMVAARLGQLTYDNLPINASFSPDVASDTTIDEHLIVIGQPDRMPLLQELELPVPVVERQLALRSEMPSAIVPGQPFSYTLTVENTSQASQTLIVEDRLPKDATLIGCGGRCEESVPGTIRWQVGRLAAGESASTIVNLRLDARTLLDENQEHTASLLDGDGNLLNVDTLAAEVIATASGGTVTSVAEKDNFMFALAGSGVAEGDGIVEETISPWSSRRALIVVTGLSDGALLKAAHALSSRSRFPGMSGTFALVQTVEVDPADPAEPALDISFTSLGYEDRVLTDISADSTQYAFDLPGKWMVSGDAYLALHLAHGVTLTSISSTLEIDLNNTPVGSVNLDEQNANDTWLNIPLPKTPLRVGRNDLNISVLGQLDRCTTIKDNQLWLTLYADSGLHLPHENANLPLDLAHYPQPFNDHSDLGDAVFSLPIHPTIAEIEGVLRLAAWLGNASRGPDFVPQVALGGNPEAEPWTGFDIIAVGRPTNNPYITAVNEALPQPFHPGTDEIRQQVDNLIYRLPAGISLGYVQELPTPQDEEQAMLVVTGTTDESVAWALAALTDNALLRELAGNLALVRGDEVRAIDTREQTAADVVEFTRALAPQLTSQATVTPTPTIVSLSPTPVPSSTPDRATGANVKAYWPKWLIPLLILSVIVAVVGIGIAIRGARS